MNLKNELNKANKIIEQQKITINNLQNQLNNLNNNINNNNNNIKSYQNIINQKEQELNKLKLELQNSQNKQYIDNNKIMAINFISMDNKLNVVVPCFDTNTFAEVEEKLYKKFPEYRETNNIFLVNRQQILRFKTIKENNIGDGLPVTMVIP